MSIDNIIRLKDCNGNHVFINQADLYESLARNDFLLFGLRMEDILAFREHYQTIGGEMPVSREKIFSAYKHEH